MKYNGISRLLALLLTLALLLAGTAVAEIEIAGEGLPNNELDLALENVDLTLPEGGIDIDLSTALDGLDAVDDAPAIDISGTPNAETTTLVVGVKEKYALDVQSVLVLGLVAVGGQPGGEDLLLPPQSPQHDVGIAYVDGQYHGASPHSRPPERACF